MSTMNVRLRREAVLAKLKQFDLYAVGYYVRTSKIVNDQVVVEEIPACLAKELADVCRCLGFSYCRVEITEWKADNE